MARNPDRFAVVALAAGGARPELLAEQAIEHGVAVVGVTRGSAAQDLQLALYAQAQRRGFASGDVSLPRLVVGPDAATEVARVAADVVLNAITGSVGLLPTLAALETGATLALANKESLIIGGQIVTDAAKPGQIVPVDSEHSALAQALRGESPQAVRRLLLTASGGPFRGRDRAALADVTPEEALAHPTWDMGPMVTVNSATLINKGLEVIEAHLLFGIPLDRIEVVVHPQSMIHSMVEYVDGSTIAQASPPDMRLPIAVALAWPDRVPGAAAGCDWSRAMAWDFAPLDDEAFPAVRLARRAGALAGTAPAVLNAANEVAVEAFLAGALPFPGIVDTVETVLSEYETGADHVLSQQRALGIDDVLGADAWARERATTMTTAGGPRRWTP
jgi:1-deoxy-D-xylulose-5-phosphate reductoisomerase